MPDTRRKRFKLPEMEGRVARWYARQRGSGSQLKSYHRQAAELAAALPDGADVLEVAPGPGYLAVELARLGRVRVTGLDISHTFVDIAGEHARQAGVTVDFRRGDVADMPLDAGSFDFVICQAAFKNFARPDRALAEMHRVLRTGGTAVIQDLNRDASGADLDAEVGRMGLSRWNRFVTKRVLSGLRRRAYSPGQFERLAAGSPFASHEIRGEGIGLEVRLHKA